MSRWSSTLAMPDRTILVVVQATDSDAQNRYLNILAATPNAILVDAAIAAAFQPNVTLKELQ